MAFLPRIPVFSGFGNYSQTLGRQTLLAPSAERAEWWMTHVDMNKVEEGHKDCLAREGDGCEVWLVSSFARARIHTADMIASGSRDISNSIIEVLEFAILTSGGDKNTEYVY